MKNILGYVTNAKTGTVTREEAQILTHIHAAFGQLTMDGDIVADLTIMKHMKEIREWNPEIKIVLSVVPQVPDAFTVVSASEELRSKVTAASGKVITEYGFDGVDFDWEYPCVPSNGMNCSLADRENYTLFCQAARKGVDEAGGGSVSIAAGADLYYINCVEPKKLAECLDYVCLMTYDLKCGFHALAGHHTALYSNIGDVFQNSCDQALRLFHQAGFPKEKLFMGSAFYSRKWENIADRNHGLLQIAKTGGGYGPGFAELMSTLIDKQGFVKYWDDEAKAPYLFDGSTFISYDDEQSIALKCEYVEKEGYGGIFYWDHASDESGTLLSVMGKCLRKE